MGNFWSRIWNEKDDDITTMRRRLARKDGELNIFTNTTTTSDGNGGHSGGGCGGGGCGGGG
jgi:uncharacterized membrane protein